jgi:hypothetical protein
MILVFFFFFSFCGCGFPSTRSGAVKQSDCHVHAEPTESTVGHTIARSTPHKIRNTPNPLPTDVYVTQLFAKIESVQEFVNTLFRVEECYSGPTDIGHGQLLLHSIIDHPICPGEQMNLSDITGAAIPAMFEYRCTGNVTMFDSLQKWNDRHKHWKTIRTVLRDMGPPLSTSPISYFLRLATLNQEAT